MSLNLRTRRPSGRGILWSSLRLLLTLLLIGSPGIAAVQEGAPSTGARTIAFLGRQASVDLLAPEARRLGLRVVQIDPDAVLAGDGPDLRAAAEEWDLLVFWWSPRAANEDQRLAWSGWLAPLLSGWSGPPVISSGRALRDAVLQQAEKAGALSHELMLSDYAGSRSSSEENLRRLVGALGHRYLGFEEGPLPPEAIHTEGFYHPDAEDLIPGVDALLAQGAGRGMGADAPRAVITTPYPHLVSMAKPGLDAFIRALEQRGVLAAAVIVREGPHEDLLRELRPNVILHHFMDSSGESFRVELNVPNLQATWLRRSSVEEWRESGGSVRDVGSLLREEVLGSIEPSVISGDSQARGDGVKQPLPDSIELLADRVLAWAKLGRTPAGERRLVIPYGAPDGSLGAFFQGTGDGRELDALESIALLLAALSEEGYATEDVPESGAELLEALQLHTHQVRSNPVEDELRAGRLELLPVAAYEAWWGTRLTPQRRAQVEQAWGPPPGPVDVWEDDRGARFFVIPCVDYGAVKLVSSPPGATEAYLEALPEERRAVDVRLPPDHSTLARACWIQTVAQPHATVRFGSFPSDALRAESPAALRPDEWTNILRGAIPSIRPHSMAALNFAMIAKRRAGAVLVGHLTPPLERAGLADELLNLSQNLAQWELTAEGGLRKALEEQIVAQATAIGLPRDMGLDGEAPIGPEDFDRLTFWLEGVAAEQVTLERHVLGRAPTGEALVRRVAGALGDDVFRALSEGLETRDSEALESCARTFVELRLEDRLSFEDALGELGWGKNTPLPESLLAGWERVPFLCDQFEQTDQEVVALLNLLDGGYIRAGPGNPPERNPAALPTGRNLYAIDPAQIPTQAAWDVAGELVAELLAERASRGGAPERVALHLHPRNVLRDYGVMEAQIMRLLGVTPVRDASDRVVGVELIPLEELGRERVDVFLAASSLYTSHWPELVQLLDEAIRLAASDRESAIATASEAIEASLIAGGTDPERAALLARSRIFGAAPGRFGSKVHDVLFEETGLWEDRSSLSSVYHQANSYVYTQGAWGVPARDAYEQQLRRSDLVLSSLVRRGALRGRSYFDAGSLSMAIESLGGSRPEHYLTDLRDPLRNRVVSAAVAVRQDLRASLLNRRWIEGQKELGYAGAHEISRAVWHALGWKISRPEIVEDEDWERIYSTYVADARELDLERWFDEVNPWAYQSLTAHLLEAARKGYWNADPEALGRLADLHLASVDRHGDGGAGVHPSLAEFVQSHASAGATATPIDAQSGTVAATSNADFGAPGEASAEDVPPQGEAEAELQRPDSGSAAFDQVEVTGVALTPEKSDPERLPWVLLAFVAGLVLLGGIRRAGQAR